MGGEGYALERALSDTALAQLRSREKRARSDIPRRSPSEMYGLSRRKVKDCMEKTEIKVVVLVHVAWPCSRRWAACCGRMQVSPGYPSCRNPHAMTCLEVPARGRELCFVQICNYFPSVLKILSKFCPIGSFEDYY